MIEMEKLKSIYWESRKKVESVCQQCEDCSNCPIEGTWCYLKVASMYTIANLNMINRNMTKDSALKRFLMEECEDHCSEIETTLKKMGI